MTALQQERMDQLIADWNTMAQANGLPTKRLPFIATSSSHKNAEKCLRDEAWWSTYKEALDIVPTCPFCMGENNRGWKATLSWFVRLETTANLLENPTSYGRGTTSRKAYDTNRSFLQADSGEDKFGGR